MKNYLSLSIASILALNILGAAHAQLFVTPDIGGVPSVSGATLENFDESSPSILTFSGSAGLVMGNFAPGAYVAPPYFSASTAAFFGESPAAGPDNTQYVAAWSGGKPNKLHKETIGMMIFFKIPNKKITLQKLCTHTEFWARWRPQYALSSHPNEPKRCSGHHVNLENKCCASRG